MPLRWTICRGTRQLVEVLADGSTGRTAIFRGLNVVFKEPPYHPDIDTSNVYTSFCEEDVAIFNRLGLNAIRLHVSWAAVEPVRGKYELQYLEKIRHIVRMCHAKGIYTLLEFHQDVLCVRSCFMWWGNDTLTMSCRDNAAVMVYRTGVSPSHGPGVGHLSRGLCGCPLQKV